MICSASARTRAVVVGLVRVPISAPRSAPARSSAARRSSSVARLLRLVTVYTASLPKPPSTIAVPSGPTDERLLGAHLDRARRREQELRETGLDAERLLRLRAAQRARRHTGPRRAADVSPVRGRRWRRSSVPRPLLPVEGVEHLAAPELGPGCVDGEHDSFRQVAAGSSCRARATRAATRATETASSSDGRTPGQILRPSWSVTLGTIATAATATMTAMIAATRSASGSRGRETAAFGERRDAFGISPVDEHERADRGERPAHDERAVGRRQGGVAQRAETGDAEHQHRGPAGRERRQREDGEHRGRAAGERAEHDREPEPRCGGRTDRAERDRAHRGDRSPRRPGRRRPLVVRVVDVLERPRRRRARPGPGSRRCRPFRRRR